MPQPPASDPPPDPRGGAPAAWVAAPDDPAFEATRAAVVSSYADLRQRPVAPAWSDTTVADRLSAIDLDAPIGLPAAVEEVATLMREGDLSSASARCFGYFNPTAAWPAVLADLLVAARNPQICVSSHAPASVAIERRVVAWMSTQLGFPDDAIGNFTSGGSEANATALLVALVRAHPRFGEEGVAAFAGRPCFYASSDCHLAWIKIARGAGLGTQAVRLIATTGDGRMDVVALNARIVADLSSGWCPVMVAATVGTTNGGEIDPIAACGDVARAHGIHLHVDAAWAGALVVDPDRRSLLAGISDADSVTIDAHKWLSVSMGAGMVFVKDRAAVARAFAVQTGYMPPGDGVDAYVTTSQWSRRFVGLRLWMMLRSGGVEAYQAMFSRQFDLADQLRAALPGRGWRIRNGSPFPLVLFDDVRHGCGSRALADALEADGTVWIGCVDYEGRTLLRACFTSFLTEEAEVRLLLDRLDAVRERLAAASA